MRTINTPLNQVGDLNEIIFAHRNKAYGAYELRKHYNHRLLKAFVIATGTTLLLLFLNANLMNQRTPPDSAGGYTPPIIDTLEDIIIEPTIETETPPPAETERIPTEVINDTLMPIVDNKDSIETNTLLASSIGSENPGSTSAGSFPGSSGGGGVIVDTTASTGNDIHKISAVMPTFPGGQKAFARYLQKNFDCSEENFSDEGKIILRFVVMKDGSILNIEVLKDNVGIDCVEEAKSVLLNSPKWNPGLQNNQPVNVQMVLPITIQKQ